MDKTARLSCCKCETQGWKATTGAGLMECQKKDNFWIKLNVNQTSFYRVSYDEELASRLRYAVETNKLSAADRYGVLDDTYALYGWQTETSLNIAEMMAVAAPEELGDLKEVPN
ncbi:aminopeptidase M1-A [Panicum miliaceum]|uniref:Aminopeptidase M1-A n=1 Tax=Panicum miliaceum TaxID=4540 RepID=A0A3L6RPN9_PANMI|nr:aminopeptidase M1-A [Panicum miliaceum]